MCQKIKVSEGDTCDSYTDVNKTVCSMIKSHGCKYDKTNSRCVGNGKGDGCESADMNMVGCMQVINEKCLWSETYRVC